jgi:hypothetical protein
MVRTLSIFTAKWRVTHTQSHWLRLRNISYWWMDYLWIEFDRLLEGWWITIKFFHTENSWHESRSELELTPDDQGLSTHLPSMSCLVWFWGCRVMSVCPDCCLNNNLHQNGFGSPYRSSENDIWFTATKFVSREFNSRVTKREMIDVTPQAVNVNCVVCFTYLRSILRPFVRRWNRVPNTRGRFTQRLEPVWRSCSDRPSVRMWEWTRICGRQHWHWKAMESWWAILPEHWDHNGYVETDCQAYQTVTWKCGIHSDRTESPTRVRTLD